ncbi:MAG: phage integrase N-terminal SAM-like domain-containing protein, partial [Desulfobulbaceae bacterium]|nr:phage integrase N-terminal SAM-like domain-containing protein [Desulfobulbaceae bacterium]
MNERLFWEKYQEAVERSGITPEKAKWYRVWAERFAKSTNKPLRDRTAHDAGKFLAGLESGAGRAPWQLAQAREALKTLFTLHLQVEWATTCNWATLSHEHPDNENSGPIKSVDLSCALGLRQAPPFLDRHRTRLANEHEEQIARLRTILRTLHYSLRTEQTYEHWVRRYLAFCEQGALKVAEAATLKRYLEYLAETREVAASTQNQALNALIFFIKQVLGAAPGEIGEFTRAKKSHHLPVVLTPAEVKRLLAAIDEPIAVLM